MNNEATNSLYEAGAVSFGATFWTFKRWRKKPVGDFCLVKKNWQFLVVPFVCTKGSKNKPYF
jgi:hypothetical protein